LPTAFKLRPFSALAALIALLAASPGGLFYPPTPVHAVVDDYFGHAVVDPYRWLEDGSAPAVQAWVARQNALTLGMLHTEPSYPIYAQRVAVFARTSTVRFRLQMAGGHYVYLRQTPPQLQAELVERDGIRGAERVLFDPQAVVGPGESPPAIETIALSFDGGKVAFTTQLGGTENETVHIVDTATGEILSDTIENAGGGTSSVALLWDGDGRGFLHTQWPLAADGAPVHAHIEIWHHVLGTDPASDTYVFGRGFSARAEYALLGSPDGAYQAIFETDGDGVHGSLYERPADGTFTRVASPAAKIGSSDNAASAFSGDRLLVISVRRSPFGEVVGIAPGSTFAQGTVLVPAGKNVVEKVAPVRGGFLTLDVDGGDSAARFFSTNGTHEALPLPPQVAITEAAANLTGSDIIVGLTSYGTPSIWLHYDPASNAFAVSGIRTTAPRDFSKLIVHRAFVRSLDGAVRIPVEIVSLPRAKRDGSAPTILSAYGSYGNITRPHFIGPVLAFLERGGVYAQAMVRGGGENGEEWHLAARLATKTKSSDDLAAVAAWLGAHGYGTARHLGITGGSAGGFLMGLALTRNPERYRAVLAAVGFYDLLRAERTPNGAYNTPEFGTVKDPEQFAWMVKQSPYENVVAGRKYPAVLMTTGENDPRVDPYNSRKMIARLQAASAAPDPVLLWQKSGQGHGIFNSYTQRVADTVATLTWFDGQLR
jgi:prolyl oligopeptidase